MLEKILRLYSMAMAVDVRSPLPHLFGPPGCGKSTVVEEAAEIIGCKMHTINVSRISPLELEGVQMPGENGKLEMLIATYWSKLNEGDILLFDEFLRGFPEVYNGLLDIITSRHVAGYDLPRVFIIAASNSTVSYDKALEDRLLHVPVADPRSNAAEKRRLAKLIVAKLGLHPDMADSFEMQTMLDTVVLPMYQMLDNLKAHSSTTIIDPKACSIRNLIGQAQLREVKTASLRELLSMNNQRAVRDGKLQYVYLVKAKDAAAIPGYEAKAKALVGNDRLTEVQALNLSLNLQLLQMEAIRNEKGSEEQDDDELLDPVF